MLSSTSLAVRSRRNCCKYDKKSTKFFLNLRKNLQSKKANLETQIQ